MEDVDPDEELARRLHREMNGLNRVRRRAPPPLPPGGRLDSLKDSRPSSAQPSGEGGHRRSESKTNDGDQSSRELHLKSQPQGFKRLRRHDDKVKAGDEGLEPQISARGMDPRESSHHERHAAQQHTDISLERQHKYDSMAASAASTVRQLAQQSMSDGEQKRVKCFYAGVRWAVSLPMEAVLTRQALASALTAALGRDEVDLGRGEQLHVVFLDHDGDESDFLPRQSGGWRPAAKTACRVYVRTQ